MCRWPTATLKTEKVAPWWRAPKALKVYFLVALVLSLGAVDATLTGCGGGGFALLGLCIPCDLIAVVVAVGIGVWSISEVLRDDDGEPCRNCAPPPEPPPPPPPTLTPNHFCVHNAQGSECPIDRITVNDFAHSTDAEAGVFDAYAPPQPGDSPDVRRMDPKEMSWPEGANPTFADGSRLLGSHVVCQLVWFDDDGDGAGDRYLTEAALVEITIHFNNGESLNLGPQWVDYGTTFVVSWDNVNGVQLLNIIP